MSKRSALTPKKLVLFFAKTAFISALVLFIFRPEMLGFREDLFQNITPASLLDVLRQVETGPAVFWLSFAVVMKLLGILSGILRWRLLLRAQGLPIPFWYLTKCWFMGRAVGLFLPGTIGLDGYRLIESARYTGETVKCTSVVVVEKIIGFVVLFSLVFITLPIGFKLFEFKLTILAAVLSVLAVFILVAFLLLLSPRTVQVLAAVVPTPRFIRNKVDEFGAAIAAFGGQRGVLLLAVVLGFGVHLGICMMYFGTVSAIRAANTSFWDVLFASSLVTVGSIIGPTVSGAGIREAGFGLVLRNKAGAASGVLSGHLGLWAGEIIPFLLSLPLLLFTTRPPREEVLAEIEQVRQARAKQEQQIAHIAPEVAAQYRRRLVNTLLGGGLGGLAAGACIGLGEGGWFAHHLGAAAELQALWWGPLVYGLVFSLLGLSLGAALAFIYLLADKFAAPIVTFAVSLGVTLAAGGGIIGAFRFRRDMLHDRALTPQQLLALAAVAAAIGLVAAVLTWLAGSAVRAKRPTAVLAGIALFAGLVTTGAVYGHLTATGPVAPAFSPTAAVSGAPNIILIAVDALRADYLPLYNNEAAIQTPALDKLAQDGTLFLNGFSQASWTKPAFATIFSGLYPEEHTATGKTSILPGQVTTLAETLHSAGYYTQGFANNPNIAALFGFDQGFVDYVDLKPSLYFGAGESSAKLTLYQVLRKARQIIQAKLRGGRMTITDFYQPAGAVSKAAADWLDANPAPPDTPFFLFMHYMDPHDPFMDHKNPGVGYARARSETPDPELAAPMADAYRQEIEYFDRYLGTFLGDLKQRGLYDGSLIFLTGDHGEEFYDHKGFWHGKTLYDEVTHVPFIVKFPQGQHAGEVNEHFARHLDIAPTAAQFAGATAPPQWRGISLVDAGGGFQNQSIAFSYAHNDFENNLLRAVRTKDCKVIHANPDNPRGLASIEVFDLTADPKEMVNIAGTGSACETTLDPLISAMRDAAAAGAAEPVLEPALPEGAQEQLESLGYL